MAQNTKRRNVLIVILAVVLFVGILIFFGLVGSGGLFSKADDQWYGIPDELKPQVEQAAKGFVSDFNNLSFLNPTGESVKLQYYVHDLKGNKVKLAGFGSGGIAASDPIKIDPNRMQDIRFSFEVFKDKESIGHYNTDFGFTPAVKTTSGITVYDDLLHQQTAAVNYLNPSKNSYDRETDPEINFKFSSGSITLKLVYVKVSGTNDFSGTISYANMPPPFKKVNFGPIKLSSTKLIEFNLNMAPFATLHACGVREPYKVYNQPGGSAYLADESTLTNAEKKCGDHQQKLGFSLAPNIEPDSSTINYSFELEVCNSKKKIEGSIENGAEKTVADFYSECLPKFGMYPGTTPTQIAQMPNPTLTPPAGATGGTTTGGYPPAYPGAVGAMPAAIPTQTPPVYVSNLPYAIPEAPPATTPTTIANNPAVWVNTQTTSIMQQNTWVPAMAQPVITAALDVYAGMAKMMQMMTGGV